MIVLNNDGSLKYVGQRNQQQHDKQLRDELQKIAQSSRRTIKMWQLIN